MAKWNITLENFGNKGELKLKKMKIKILNFLCKIAADCKNFDYKNFNHIRALKCSFYSIDEIFPKI